MTLEKGKNYIMARAASGRPTLQHRLSFQLNGEISTLCGLDTSTWSRAYFRQAIPELICKRCDRSPA